MAETGTEKRRHDQPVLVRLTAEQLEQVDRAAAAVGLNRTGWIRMVLLKASAEQLDGKRKR